MQRLGDLTKDDLAALLAGTRPVVALVPVGSVEPHGPHLPLSTDTIISESAIERAAALLDGGGAVALRAPAVPFGVTKFAEGFAGAIGVEPGPLTSFLASIASGFLATGFAHVCFVNNHLEPDHDAAVRAAIAGLTLGSASVACPLTRRWARTLSDEFKSGACHAGRYETSLVLASEPQLVREARAQSLAGVSISLSEGIKAGRHSFREMGMTEAYAGEPALASRAEGEAQLELLATMIATEVLEALAHRPQAV